MTHNLAQITALLITVCIGLIILLRTTRPKAETAAERLERIVRETRESYEIQRFRERRDAAKRGWQRRRLMDC